MICIAGLGNPGKEYENTWHNAGFLGVERLRKKLGFDDFKKKAAFNAEICEGERFGNRIILIKPLAYMNRSGEAIQKVLHFYKIPLQNLWLIYDDIDLRFGDLRIRKQGSAGTHNGVKSVIQHLGSENFPRFRLGIKKEGSEEFRQTDLKSYILSRIPSKDKKTFTSLLDKTVEALMYALEKGTEQAMNKYNS